MSIFKCKMCGGNVEFESGATVGVCDSCGTKQTLPRLDDDRRANLYDRANHFRRNNEFDKAVVIYEQILTEDTTDAEAYWSLVLCQYGIEYVEDPATHKRVPTINRAQFTSIFDDDNYKSALQYADGYQRELYEKEAKMINDIQKGILAISQKEEPFDVFICYKETDNNGRRTPDSVLANDLYHQLTQEGFKVFFARITLEDKLGTVYEPYIFAALNSSKVMVVLGTNPEHFNAVWVKNEWSRYLALVKKSGGKKVLIPAYKDMDPYDLPEEFSHLQAQDMSKLGFMQDLIRGIKKIVEADTPKTTVVKETVINGGNDNTVPLLKRAFMFLEDGDWNSANEYCEKVLDIDPENASAYLGKLLSELRVKNQEALKDQAEPFDNSNNYHKAIRFADENLKGVLNNYIAIINENIKNRKRDNTLSEGKSKMNGGDVSNYEIAIDLFKSISGWKDADEQIVACQNKIDEIKAKKEAERLESERKAEIRRKEAERIAKRIKKKAIITTPIVCTVIAFVIVLNTVIIPVQKKNSFIATYGQEIYDKFGLVEKGKYIKFGTYEQDNNTSNGKEDIEWLVLEVKDGKALLISKYILDGKPYNEKDTGDNYWEICTLRKWLNNDFISAAFLADEKAMIPTVTVSADKNPRCKANPGKATQDQVFLLSITEVNKYFMSDDARRCRVTSYVVAKDLSYSDKTYHWWLRSPLDSGYADAISFAGEVYWYYTEGVCGVRPALWIDLGD